VIGGSFRLASFISMEYYKLLYMILAISLREWCQRLEAFKSAIGELEEYGGGGHGSDTEERGTEQAQTKL
jgi:hypothetical protein